MYHILVVGAGYLGSEIAKYFQQKEQKTFALTRSEEKAGVLKEQGINPVVADLSRPETLKDIPPAHFIIITVAPDSRSEEAYYDTYVTGVGNFLKSIQKNPRPFMVLYISSTGIWDQEGLDWVDESAKLNPVSKRAKILKRAEDQILSSGFPSAILRLSGIYGPGRNRLSRIREASWPDASLEDRYMNLIHRDDIVANMPAILKSAKEGSVYIGTDSYPVPRSEFYDWMASEMKLEKKSEYFEKDRRRSFVGGKRLRNSAFIDLGVELKYPTYKEGYRWLIDNGE